MRKIIKVYFDKCLSVPKSATQFGFFNLDINMSYDKS